MSDEEEEFELDSYDNNSLNNSTEMFIDELVNLFHEGNERVEKLQDERDRVNFEIKV